MLRTLDDQRQLRLTEATHQVDRQVQKDKAAGDFSGEMLLGDSVIISPRR